MALLNLNTCRLESQKPCLDKGVHFNQNGSKIGETAIVYEKSNKANGYNFIRDSQLSAAVRDMNGNPSFASSKLRSETLSYSGGSQSRYWIRDVAKQCGGYVEGFSQGRVNVVTTENPTGNITPPYSPSAGSTEDISFTAESHVHNLSGYGTRIDWKLYVNNNQIESGWKYGGIDETVPYTFNSEGTYEIKLEITDQVQRTSVITETVTVGSGGSTPPPNPPEPPPYNPPPEKEPGDPVADFSMPRKGEVETPVSVIDNSWSPDGYIVQWDWDVSPSGNYDEDLGDTGGEITFFEEGYFTVNLTVIDSNGKFDRTSKSIRIEDNREPPNAYFRVSDRKISYGDTIEVYDESTPGSAPIVDWDWDISPSNGVTEDLDDTGGTVQFDELGEYEITLTVEDENGFTDDYSRTIEVINLPPEADFDISTKLMQGEDVVIKDESVQGDSEIASYEWEIDYPDGADESHIVGDLPAGIGEETTFYFDKEGTYTLRLVITDVLGDSDTREIDVEVEPAVPVADFNWDGYWKQNRLVTLTNNSTTSDRYPIENDGIKWEFRAVGNGAVTSSVKIDEDGDYSERRIIVKEPGTYNIKLTVTNKAGHSDTYEKEFNIEEDKPPEAAFNIQSAYLRDPGNSNIASIQLTGKSFSPDGDKIAERNWRYKYDSDNDGSFDDEAWVYPGDGSWVYIDSDGNRRQMQSGDNVRNPIIETTEVGKYYVELEVVEGFGQPTISKFINSSDILKDDTLHRPMSEKTGEVINVRPSVGFDVKKKKKADIIFTIGDIDPNKVSNINGLINTYLKSELNSENVDYGTIETSDTSTVSTEDADAALIFNEWENYPNSVGNWELAQVNGQNVIRSTVNTQWTGFWKQDNAEKIEMEFDTGVTTSGDDDWVGFTIRMNRHNPGSPGNPYNGDYDAYDAYVFALDGGGIKHSGLYKLEKAPFTNNRVGGHNMWTGQWRSGNWVDDITYFTQSGTKTPYQVNGYSPNDPKPSNTKGKMIPLQRTNTANLKWKRYDYQKVKVIAEGNNIKVWVDGKIEIDYTDNSNPINSGGYGVFAASQSHGTFKNLSVTTKSIKTLDEVLKEPNWREDALRFLVNLSDVEEEGLNDENRAALIYSRLLDDEIDFSVLGTASNRAQTLDVISKNDGNGKFVYNNNPDMEHAMQEISEYIINKINDEYDDVLEYVLLNEEVIYDTFYNDHENDPKFDERWKYEHDPYYFENSMGTVSYDGQWKGSPVYRFGKVGEFIATFQVQDNPKDDERFAEYRKWSYQPSGDLRLKVHRRPVAAFLLNLQQTYDSSEVKIFEDFEDSNFNLNFSGDWSRSSYRKYSGNYSYRSKNIRHNQKSIAEFKVDIPSNATDGRISFRHLVKSESRYDYLRIYIDGSRVVNRSGNGSWAYYEKNLSPGEHTIKFEYSKDRSVSKYDDAGYVDNIQVTYTIPISESKIENIQSNAYDLDRYSESYHGISEEKWSWRDANSATWIEYPVNNLGNRGSVLNTFKNDLNSALSGGGNFLIKYEVKDKQGVWSKPNVRLVTNTDQPPVASFSVIPNPVIQNHSVSYKNNSYDPNGDDIVEEDWSIEYPGGSIDFPGSPPNSYSNTGNHKIGLRVRDANGNWSEWHYQNLEVILENQRPVADFNISPNPLPADVPLQYQDNSYDPDGHPIVAREWQYQKVGGSWKIGQVTDFSSLGPGDYLIRLKVRDDPPPPLGAKDSSWHTNNLTVVQSNEKPVARFTVNPNPGIADQPITYNDTSYDPDGAGISERVWRVETQSGTILGEYHNSLPPSIFASTGWGDGGAGDYRIGLKVKD